MDREKVIKGLEILMNGCEYIQCEDCCFYISTKPFRCGLREEQIQEDALALLKEQQEQIDRLLEESASNAEMAEGMKELLKEQEAVVRCKDCANGEVCTQSWDGVQYVECHAHEEEGYDHEDGHPLDWFCADGKRRTD